MSSESSKPSHDSAPMTSFTALFVRLYWAIFGHVLSLPLITLIAQKKDYWVILDLGILLIMASVISVRWIDITKFNGTTLEGNICSKEHWQNFSIKVVIIYFLIIVSAHAVAIYY